MANQAQQAADIVKWAEQRDAAGRFVNSPGPGRHSLLTDDLTEQVRLLVQRGHYVTTVCQSIGISRETYYNWLETATQQRDASPAADTPHTRFADAVKTAEAQAEIALGESWLEASDKGWLKYATFASRRFRKHWHDKEPEQHNTFVQNNYALMPGQAGYVTPELPPAIEADVVSPPRLEGRGEG